MKTSFFIAAAIAGSIGGGGASALGQGCPPGLYQYGPATWDLEIEQIVADHYGPTGPLTPLPEDYERAERDIGLIRVAIPGVPGHTGAWQARVLVVSTNSTTVIPKLTCTNTHFQAQMIPVGSGPLWLVEFPRGVNLLAMAALYDALPEVLGAGVNVFGGIGCTVFDTWSYETLPDGTWKWRILHTYPCGFGGMGCCYQRWTVDISAAGVVCILPDCNNDGVLTVADFGCFQTRFVMNHPWADCDGNGVLTVADFGCYQKKFVAGCE